MIVRARAPLRLGFAGGGTDVSPYADRFGGAVMNATIARYAYATIEILNGDRVLLESVDQDIKKDYPAGSSLTPDGHLDLLKAVYNRIMRDYNGGKFLSLKISTYSEAPPGSGLGSSSTLVVALVTAFGELLSLSLGEYDIASLAYVIERKDAQLSGGRQDQYAAAFGGFNYMEFHQDEHVIVNPLRIRTDIINELEARIVLCFTGVSRQSASIISEQSDNVEKNDPKSLEAMHAMKSSAGVMKEALLRGDFIRLAAAFQDSWKNKINMAKSITNSHINQLLDVAVDAGAYAGKISGAGGGGFMMFLVEPERRLKLINALKAQHCTIESCNFTKGGARAWRI
jgi:D-glycero-alpha-D-manno-heptose-7-phosphate kinase